MCLVSYPQFPWHLPAACLHCQPCLQTNNKTPRQQNTRSRFVVSPKASRDLIAPPTARRPTFRNTLPRTFDSASMTKMRERVGCAAQHCRLGARSTCGSDSGHLLERHHHVNEVIEREQVPCNDPLLTLHMPHHIHIHTVQFSHTLLRLCRAVWHNNIDVTQLHRLFKHTTTRTQQTISLAVVEEGHHWQPCHASCNAATAARTRSEVAVHCTSTTGVRLPGVTMGWVLYSCAFF